MEDLSQSYRRCDYIDTGSPSALWGMLLCSGMPNIAPSVSGCHGTSAYLPNLSQGVEVAIVTLAQLLAGIPYCQFSSQFSIQFSSQFS